MDNSTERETRELDNQLADFADKAISGHPLRAEQISIDQDDMAKLQKTVVQVSLAAQAAQPDSAASARIRQRLMVEWQKNHQPEPSAFKRISVFWSSSRLVLFASVVVVLLVGIFLSIPASGDSNSLAGAAQGSITGWPFLGIISIVVIVITIVFWINRRH